MPVKKKKTAKKLSRPVSKRRVAKPKMSSAKKKVSRTAKKPARWCRRCHYCDEGTVFRQCLRCGNCFCEYHAEAVGYCDQCGSGKKKAKKAGKPKKRAKR